MRVEVDELRCAASAECELICPEVFEVEDVARVKVPEPPPELADRVREAAEACPTGAIRVYE
jgi:ferredoxin